MLIQTPHIGFDYIIIVTSGAQEAAYWGATLGQLRGAWLPATTRVLVTTEADEEHAGLDWGALLSVIKVARMLQDTGQDLWLEMQNGKSVAVYSVAGMGQRMAPLTFAESNSKARVRVPWLGTHNQEIAGTTLLAAILASLPFAAAGSGRLFVFPCDQVLLAPEPFPLSKSTWAIELIGARQKAHGLLDTAYGQLVVSGREVRRYVVARYRWPSDTAPDCDLVRSLGCYSMSVDFLRGMLCALRTMGVSGFTSRAMHAHGLRLTELASIPLIPAITNMCSPAMAYHTLTALTRYYDAFTEWWVEFYRYATRGLQGQEVLVGYADLDADAIFLDYGQLAAYRRSVLALLKDTPEGSRIRKFFGMPAIPWHWASQTGEARVVNSLVQNSRIVRGEIDNSVVVDLEAEEVHIKDSVVIGGCIATLLAVDSIIYDAVGTSVRAEHQALAEVVGICQSPLRVKIDITADIKAHWESSTGDSASSFADTHKRIQQTVLPRAAGDLHSALGQCKTVSLLMLKGGVLGGLGVRDRILETLHPFFHIVAGKIRTPALSEIVMRWRSTLNTYRICKELGANQRFLNLLGTTMSLQGFQQPSDWFSRLCREANPILREFLESCVNYFGRKCQVLLLIRQVDRDTVLQDFGLVSEGRIHTASIEEQDFVKLLVGNTNPYLAERGTLRGGIMLEVLQRGLLQEMRHMYPCLTSTPNELVATLANGIHAASASELDDEVALLHDEDRHLFLAALRH